MLAVSENEVFRSRDKTRVWRNWQTRQIQVLVVHSRTGSSPATRTKSV